MSERDCPNAPFLSRLAGRRSPRLVQQAFDFGSKSDRAHAPIASPIRPVQKLTVFSISCRCLGVNVPPLGTNGLAFSLNVARAMETVLGHWIAMVVPVEGACSMSKPDCRRVLLPSLTMISLRSERRVEAKIGPLSQRKKQAARSFTFRVVWLLATSTWML